MTALARVALEPITIMHTVEHEYMGVPEETRCRLRMDGLLCMKGPNHPMHRGYAPSTNNLGSGDRKGYQSAKKVWSANWRGHVEKAAAAAGWPKGDPTTEKTDKAWSGVGRIMAECHVAITQRRDIDADNIGYGTAKPLGDSLVEMGLLRKDTFRHFSIGEVTFSVEDDAPWTRITFFASWEPLPWEQFDNRGARAAAKALF